MFLADIDNDIIDLPSDVVYVYTDQLFKYKKRYRSRRCAQTRRYWRCKLTFMEEWVDKFNGYTIVPGNENYDFLKYSLTKYGWDSRWPLLLRKQNHKWKVRNGNHRLSICHDLNIKTIPIILKR
jgi:hypothetical protein